MPMRDNAGGGRGDADVAVRGADAVEMEPDAKAGMTTPMKGMVASMRGDAADGASGDADTVGGDSDVIIGDGNRASWCVGWPG